jgi:hypothetical protein
MTVCLQGETISAGGTMSEKAPEAPALPSADPTSTSTAPGLVTAALNLPTVVPSLVCPDIPSTADPLILTAAPAAETTPAPAAATTATMDVAQTTNADATTTTTTTTMDAAQTILADATATTTTVDVAQITLADATATNPTIDVAQTTFADATTTTTTMGAAQTTLGDAITASTTTSDVVMTFEDEQKKPVLDPALVDMYNAEGQPPDILGLQGKSGTPEPGSGKSDTDERFVIDADKPISKKKAKRMAKWAAQAVSTPCFCMMMSKCGV